MTVSASTPDLAERVASMVAGPARAPLLRALRAEVVSPGDFEGSVRGDADGTLRAGRMMVERASPAVVHALFRAMGIVVGPIVQNWLGAAALADVPLIAGWDAGRPTPCAKLYVNASDVAVQTRRRLASELLPSAAAQPIEPAVLGLNARSDGEIEIKVYVQSSDAVALADGLPAAAQNLARAARAERADAGGVVCYDVTPRALIPRAFFVATREATWDRPWRFLHDLPGFDIATVTNLFPFPPAAPRSIGVSLAGANWTLYCKPRGTGRAPHALEPAAIYRTEGSEVGVFVEANEHAARAFRRTDRHAVSVRIRDGEPNPEQLEALVDWFTAELRGAERRGADMLRPAGTPPAPWRAVDLGLGDAS